MGGVSAYPEARFVFPFVKFSSDSEVLNQSSHLVFAPCTELKGHLLISLFAGQ